MRKSFLFIVVILFFSCKNSNERNNNEILSVDTVNSELEVAHELTIQPELELEPFSFVSKMYKLRNTNILYTTYTNRKEIDIFKNYDELYKLLEIENIIGLEEYSRKILSDSLTNYLFNDDGLDTITICSNDNKFETKAKRIGVEWFYDGLEDQFITTFMPLKSLAYSNSEDFYGYKLVNSQITLENNEYLLASNDEFLPYENIVNDDSCSLLSASFWRLTASNNLKYGYKSYENPSYSTIYRIENCTITFQDDIILEDFIIRRIYPLKLQLNQFPIFIAEFAVYETDFLIDAVLYYSDEKINVSYGMINK